MVFRNKPALAFISGYVAHCWELYGVARLDGRVSDLRGRQATGVGPGLDAPTLASIISLGGIA